MRNLKNNSAISLVALVVTIVVLLILASITYNGMLGSDGVITKAQDAQRKTEMSKAEETIKTIILNTQVLTDRTSHACKRERRVVKR